MHAPLVIAGRYVVLRRLGAGGMAEVFLARHRGHAGFERLVVVKRTRESHANDSDFRALFLDEARVAADLRHPNIVAVQDFGEHEGRFFLVMEFLHGQDVAHIAQRLSERRAWLPIVHALEIIMGIGTGLHAAHTKTDFDGEPLELVHRDVSPQNVFVTYDGEVKLLDFGIARARGHDPHTEAGYVRGKHGYFAPEQLDGVRVDHRTDQFALGILLFELTTGHPLFRRKNLNDSIFALVNHDVPRPSALVDDYPREIEDITLRALSPDPDERFPSCLALVDAIDDYVARAGLSPSPRRLARFLRSHFADKIEDDRSLGSLPVHALPHESANAPLLDDSRVETAPASPFAFPDDERDVTPPPLLGRTLELARVKSLLQGDTPLVALVGHRGSGKSKLAKSLMASWVSPSQARLIDAEAIASPEELVRRIAAAFGGILPSTLPLAGLLEKTRARLAQRAAGADGVRPLVVIDNLLTAGDEPFRRVLDALVADDAARVVVTTRSDDVPGTAIVLESVPSDGAVDASHDDGSGVFAELSPEARAALGGSGHDVESLLSLAEGNPLALRLLGAQLAHIDARALFDEVSRRTSVDARVPGLDALDAPLSRVISTCLALLGREERRLLTVLACARAALPYRLVERALAPHFSAPLDALASTLAERALATLVPSRALDGDLMLEIEDVVALHAHASALDVDVDDALVARAFRPLEDGARQLARAVDGPGGRTALARLRQHVPVLRLAIRRALAPHATRDDIERAVHATLALDAVFAIDGFPSSHQQDVEALSRLAARAALPPALRAELSEARGDTARAMGALDEAHAAYLEAIELATAGGAPVFAAIAERNAADLDRLAGRLETARARLERALACFERSGDRPLEARALLSLAHVEQKSGDSARARRAALRALDIFRHIGDRRFEGRALLTYAALDADVERADKLYRRAIEIHAETGERHLEGHARLLRANALEARGRHDDAAAERARAAPLVDVVERPLVEVLGNAPAVRF